jgi:hypothetical protein
MLNKLSKNPSMGNKFKLVKIINKKNIERDVKKELEDYDLEP